MNEPTPPPSPQKPGGLGKLERELYARDTSPELAARLDDIARLGIRREPLSSPEAGTTAEAPLTFLATRDTTRARRRRVLTIAAVGAALALVLVAAVAATIWYRVRQTVTGEQITLAVTGPSEVQAGDEITYVINYGNTSAVDWENVEVSLEIPSGLTLTATTPEGAASGNYVRWNVGTLASGATDSVSVTGRLIGAENATVITRAEIQLTPENFPSGRFSHTALLSTTITAAPIEVAVVAAQGAAVGERVAVTINITNKSEETLEGAYLELNPAVGMELATEDPEFSPNYSTSERVWELPPLGSLETISRTVILFIEGTAGEQRALEVVSGLIRNNERFVQQRTAAVLTITSSALGIDQSYQKGTSPLVVKAGESIQGVITYTNVGTGGLKNLIVRAQIVGDSFDPASLKLPAGAYDPTTRTITWTSATVPELALVLPQQKGEIKYEFAIKETAQLPADPSSKNSTLVITAFVDSPDVVVPVGQERKAVQDQFVMSVASDITLAADAFYDDGRLGITSAGPTPPQAGQETTYTLRLRLGSTLNDIGDVRVTAVLPDGVRYTGKNVVTTGEIAFEERTGELVWSMPQIAGLQGRASPSADLYFQVAIIPGEHQSRQIIPFLNKLVATGLDLFVDQKLTTEVTAYPTTETAVPGKGRVE